MFKILHACWAGGAKGQSFRPVSPLCHVTTASNLSIPKQGSFVLNSIPLPNRWKIRTYRNPDGQNKYHCVTSLTLNMITTGQASCHTCTQPVSNNSVSTKHSQGSRLTRYRMILVDSARPSCQRYISWPTTQHSFHTCLDVHRVPGVLARPRIDERARIRLVCPDNSRL